jgi:DNA-binding LacI/PurR family transcriptional regulator/DNA-binding transcriptional regulator YhcF (GntR family)
LQRTFHLSRSEQLAHYLRDCIARRELTEPLPGTRDWCEAVGVSRNTLKQALKILQREGWLRIEPRRPIRIQRQPRSPKKPTSAIQPVVRVIYYRQYYSSHSRVEFYPALVERLHPHDIRVTLEGCSHARIRELARQPASPNELLFLASLPSAWYRYFDHMTCNAMILGHPNPASPLSYATMDIEGGVRHATQLLLRSGLSRVSLLITRGFSQGLLEAIRMFQRTCAEWPHQPVEARTVSMRYGFEEQRADTRRFAASVRAPQGILVWKPVSLSLVMTALLERGIGIPRPARVVALMTDPDSTQVCPTPPHYPFPMRAYIRQVAQAALHYFETGSVPRLRAVLPVELVP